VSQFAIPGVSVHTGTTTSSPYTLATSFRVASPCPASSLFFCGITLNHYIYHTMSRTSRTQFTTPYIFPTFAQLSENLFSYISASPFSRAHPRNELRETPLYPHRHCHCRLHLLHCQWVEGVTECDRVESTSLGGAKHLMSAIFCHGVCEVGRVHRDCVPARGSTTVLVIKRGVDKNWTTIWWHGVWHAVISCHSVG